VRRDAARRGESGGAELRDDAAVERACVEEAVGLAGADRADDFVVDIEARHVGEEDELLRAQPESERGRCVVGVDVQRPDRERCDDGNLPRRERGEDRLRPARERVADPAEGRHRDGEDAGDVADDGNREVAERGAERVVHGDERFPHDLEREPRRAPAALHELHRDAAPLHLLRDLRAGAVDDNDFVALLAQAEDPVCRLGGDCTADLHHQPAHVPLRSLLSSVEPTLMICTPR